MKKNKLASSFTSFSRSLIALLVALLIGGIIITLGGYSFIEVYIAIFKGSLGTSRGMVLSLATSMPLMLTGLGFAIGIKVGIVNTGLEGQLFAGGMAAALVGAYIPLPDGIHAVVAMLAAALGGGMIGALMGWFRVRFGAPEVISGIMLNSIVMLFNSYLANGPLKPPNVGSAQTKQILPSAELTKIIPKSQLTTAFVVAIVMCGLIYLMQKKTIWGFKMQVVGLNPRAAAVAGINSSRMYLLALALSGAMAGLAGGSLVLGVFKRFIEALSNGLGFQGIPVSALASHNPLGVILSALLFGVLKAGSTMVNQSTAIPFEFVDVVQALVVVFVAAPTIIGDFFTFLYQKCIGLFVGVKDRKTARGG